MTMANVRGRMTHRATVERRADTDANPYGHSGPPEWEADEETMPCWLYTSRASEIALSERTAVVGQVMLLAPKDYDIDEQDRINGVEDRAGATVLAGVLNIRSVLPHHTHKELILERVS